MAFAAGAILPASGSALRHKFPARDRLYLWYWLKYSASWVGRGAHEIYFTTTADGDHIGPPATPLTGYVVHVYRQGGIHHLSFTDALKIDVTKISTHLVGQTELRSIAGCNRNGDAYQTVCDALAGGWRNDRACEASHPWFTNTPGPGYKNAWHQIESYVQLNSIQDGVGVADGIARYWFDGRLVLDKRNVLLRTGANPNMKFTQFLVALYIAAGATAAYTKWVDDLVIATGPVP